MVVARSTSVTDSYDGCRSNPVLTHRHLGRRAEIVGTSHADLVQAVDRSWWAVLLAMRPYGGYHYPLGRETFLVPVEWQEGWTSLRGPGDPFLSARDEGRTLRLSATTLRDPSTPALLGVRQQHRCLDFDLTLRAPLALVEEAGLVIRQSESDHVRLAVFTAPTGVVVVRAVHVRAGAEVLLGEVRPDVAVGENLRLGVQVRDTACVLTAAVGHAAASTVATADGRQLDSVAAGGFIGLLLGVYATNAGSESGTVVEIDTVEYHPR